jgi:hypothetical protein
MKEAMAEPYESWRIVFRKGLAPLLTVPQLEALREALRTDDPRLLQGCTTTPPPLQCVRDWLVEAACLFGFCGVAGRWGEATVGEAEQAFAALCYAVDQAIGEPAAGRWLMNWYDETPRAEMIAALFPEVERELARRAVYPPACIHHPAFGLCRECQADFDADPAAYAEYGDHPAGIAASKALRAEMLAGAVPADEPVKTDLPF